MPSAKMRAGTTMILGGGPTADQAVEAAGKAGHQVLYAHDGSVKPSSDTSQAKLFPVELASYDSITSAFLAAKALSPPKTINTLVLVVPPASPAFPDIADVDQVLWPFVQAIKVALYHWRRAPTAESKRLVFSAERGEEDLASQVLANAIIGLYKSILPTLTAVGVKSHLVHVTRRNGSPPASLGDVLLSPAAIGPSGHLAYEGHTTIVVDAEGHMKAQHPYHGNFTSAQTDILFQRFNGIIASTKVVFRISTFTAYLPYVLAIAPLYLARFDIRPATAFVGALLLARFRPLGLATAAAALVYKGDLLSTQTGLPYWLRPTIR